MKVSFEFDVDAALKSQEFIGALIRKGWRPPIAQDECPHYSVHKVPGHNFHRCGACDAKVEVQAAPEQEMSTQNDKR